MLLRLRSSRFDGAVHAYKLAARHAGDQENRGMRAGSEHFAVRSILPGSLVFSVPLAHRLRYSSLTIKFPDRGLVALGFGSQISSMIRSALPAAGRYQRRLPCRFESLTAIHPSVSHWQDDILQSGLSTTAADTELRLQSSSTAALRIRILFS